MEIFISIFLKILPLYLSIFLGYICTKYLHVDKQSIAKMLMYIFSTIVIFKSVISIKIDEKILILPIFFYILSSITAIFVLKLFQKKLNQANILAFSCGTGNTGYFGIPLAIIFFPSDLVDVFIFMLLASFLYESTTGFYVVAKGNLSTKQALRKILRFPPIYAFIFGLIFNLFGIKIPHLYIEYLDGFKHAYAILGMMMIGFGLQKLKGNINIRFLSISFFAKFIYLPLIVLIFIYLDKHYFYFLDENLYKLAFIFSIVPLAGNSVTYAVLFNQNPQSISFSVFLSTIFSLFYLPLMLFLYGGFY